MLKAKSTILSLAAFAVLSGCSSVGPGFKNHPGDCAMGIPWADCLPGTAGYANGGGELHRAEAAKQEAAAKMEHDAVTAQCKSSYQTPDLDPIRHKVELFRDSFDSPVPFEIATNDNFPTAEERAAIAKWATLRENCVRRGEALATIPPSATPLQVAFIQQDRSFFKDADVRVGDLIVALYQGKLTYGEFADRRYEITHNAGILERQFRQAALIADQERQMEARRLALEQFQNSLNAWSTYMQSVAARQPETVRLNCISQQIGSMVTTDCH